MLYFGRRYYSSHLGRWITTDPNGFADGPNLYAYVHNSPLTLLDQYGLFSYGAMWQGAGNFLGGAWDYSMAGLAGAGHCLGKMGEWMYSDFQYEYFNEQDLFHDKAWRAIDGWTALGAAARDNPFNLIVPGIVEALHNPTDPRAWGKAAVDTALIAFTVTKACGTLSNITKAARIGEEFSTVGKLGTGIGTLEKAHIPPTTCTVDFVSGVRASSFGKVIGEGTVPIRPTINAIENKTLLPRNAIGYLNKEAHPQLLGKPAGYWQEYHLLDFGGKSPLRILRGGQGEYFLSPDHYRTIIPLN